MDLDTAVVGIKAETENQPLKGFLDESYINIIDSIASPESETMDRSTDESVTESRATTKTDADISKTEPETVRDDTRPVKSEVHSEINSEIDNSINEYDSHIREEPVVEEEGIYSGCNVIFFRSPRS